MWSEPLATMMGAPSPVGSYSSATAKCSGLVMTTSASLTRCIIRALAISRWRLRIWTFTSGLPSICLNSSLISCKVIRMRLVNAYFW